MIDIRSLPVSYLNMQQDSERDHYMIQHLALNGFTNEIHRQNAHISGQANIYPSATVGMCQSLWWLYMHCTDDYVLHLEDDIEFENIDHLNDTINGVITNDDFTAFVISTCEQEPRCYSPPEKKDCLAHFMLVKRIKIPMFIHGLFMTHIMINNVDNWGFNMCKGIYVYTGYECHQLYYYFPSSNHGVKGTLSIPPLLIRRTDKPMAGKRIYEAFNEGIKTPIPKHVLSLNRCYLLRVFQLDEDMISILRPNGIVDTVKIPLNIYNKYKETTNSDIIYRFISDYEIGHRIGEEIQALRYDDGSGKFILIDLQ